MQEWNNCLLWAKKQAQPTGNDEEEGLWQVGIWLLGDHSAQVHVDTMVYIKWGYFLLFGVVKITADFIKGGGIEKGP